MAVNATFRRAMLPAVTGVSGGSLLVVLAALSSPYVAAAGIVSMLGGVWLVVNPQIGLLLTAAVAPLERIGRLSDDSATHSISLMRMIGVGTLAAFLFHSLLWRRRLMVTLPLGLYSAYLFVAILTLAHTTDFTYGVRSVGSMLANVMFFFLVINMVRTPMQARAAIICWLLTTSLIAVFTIYQWHNPAAIITEDPFNSSGERTVDQRFSTVLSDVSEYQVLQETPRALGSTSHPAVYGINLILSLPFFAYLFRTTGDTWLKLVIAAAGLLTAYNVVLANTRAALITMGVSVALILWTRIIRVTPRVIAAGACAVVLALPLVPTAIWERVLNPFNYTVGRSDTLRSRLMYWEEGAQMVSENWLMGIGIGNQTELPRRLSSRMHMPPNSTVHNEYLQSLLETGILGYPLLVGFIAVLYVRCCKGARASREHGDDDTAFLFTAARVALLSVLFYATQVDVLHFPLKGWWLAMGIVVALTERSVWRTPAVLPEAS